MLRVVGIVVCCIEWASQSIWERESFYVCLMCSIVNKRIEIVTKLYWNQKHESDRLNAVESCMGTVSSSWSDWLFSFGCSTLIFQTKLNWSSLSFWERDVPNGSRLVVKVVQDYQQISWQVRLHSNQFIKNKIITD